MRRIPVGGAGRDVGAGVCSEVHRIDARLDRELDHPQLLLEGLAIGLVVLDRVDADPQGELGPEPGADGPQDVNEESRPVLDRAAPTVGARVHRWGQELVDQVTVSGVQFDAVEARTLATLGRVDEALDHPREIALGGRLVGQLRGRLGVRPHHRRDLTLGDHGRDVIGLGGLRRRRHQHRAPVRGVQQRHLAVVGDLRRNPRAVAMHARGQVDETGEVDVIGRGSLALIERTVRIRDRHRADEEQARTAARPCLEVGRLVVAHRAVDVGQAVAHGRHDDAVAQLERSDVTGRKQMFE